MSHYLSLEFPLYPVPAVYRVPPFCVSPLLFHFPISMPISLFLAPSLYLSISLYLPTPFIEFLVRLVRVCSFASSLFVSIYFSVSLYFPDIHSSLSLQISIYTVSLYLYLSLCICLPLPAHICGALCVYMSRQQLPHAREQHRHAQHTRARHFPCRCCKTACKYWIGISAAVGLIAQLVRAYD